MTARPCVCCLCVLRYRLHEPSAECHRWRYYLCIPGTPCVRHNTPSDWDEFRAFFSQFRACFLRKREGGTHKTMMMAFQQHDDFLEMFPCKPTNTRLVLLDVHEATYFPFSWNYLFTTRTLPVVCASFIFLIISVTSSVFFSFRIHLFVFVFLLQIIWCAGLFFARMWLELHGQIASYKSPCRIYLQCVSLSRSLWHTNYTYIPDALSLWGIISTDTGCAGCKY